jgi:hypothetical protein
MCAIVPIKTRVLLILALLACLSAESQLAAEPLTTGFIALHPSAVVARIAYSGNDRTRASSLAELTGLRPGMKLGEIEPELVEQRLVKSGLFSQVELSCDLEAGEAHLTVKVEEKRSLLPIPFASFGGGDWSAGLTLLEFNFLGSRKTLIANGSASNLGASAALIYLDPRLGDLPLGLAVAAQGGRRATSASYMEGTSFADFTEDFASGSIGFEYPSEAPLRATAAFKLRYAGMDRGDAESQGLYERAFAVSPRVGLKFDGQRTVDYHREGPYLNLSYERGFRIVGVPSYDSTRASGKWEQGLGGGIRAAVGAAGRYGSESLQELDALAGPGYRTLPKDESFASKSWAAYGSIEAPFLRTGWGVMTLGAFYEVGAYETGFSNAERLRSFQGPGASYRLYLKKLALPAVGVDFAWNSITGELEISGAFGKPID